MMLYVVLLLACRVLVTVPVLWSSEHLSPTRHTSLYLEIISSLARAGMQIGFRVYRESQRAVCLNIHPVIVVL